MFTLFFCNYRWALIGIVGGQCGKCRMRTFVCISGRLRIQSFLPVLPSFPSDLKGFQWAEATYYFSEENLRKVFHPFFRSMLYTRTRHFPAFMDVFSRCICPVERLSHFFHVFDAHVHSFQTFLALKQVC